MAMVIGSYDTDTHSETSIVDQLAEACLYVSKEIHFIPQASESGYAYLLYVKEGDSYLRCDELAREFIVRCDGESSLASLLDSLPETNNEQHRRDLEDTLTLLINMGVLAVTDDEKSPLPWLHKLKQPMAVKLPLYNPNQWLTRLAPLGRMLFGRMFLLFFALFILYSASVFAVHWPVLASHWQSRFFDPSNAFLMLLAYPVMKAMHELGHGLAVKRFGGDVYECGIIFLVFIPLPYVDASASYRFSKRRQRVIVGMAGMLVEFFLALCALNVWVYSNSGSLMSDLIFDLFFIGTFSTLVFNINPLMKFDGYYILSDILGIDNLSTKAKAYIGAMLAHRVLGLTKKNHMVRRKERVSFLIYGFLSIPYRVLVSLWITLYLSTVFFVLGMLLALYVMVQQLFLPLYSGLKRTYQQVVEQQCEGRFYTALGGAVIAVFVFGFVCQFRMTLSASGIVQQDINERVVAQVSGFIQSPLSKAGEWVEKGQPILRLTNPSLQENKADLQAQLAELQARYDLFLSQDPLASADILEQVKSMEQRLVEVNRQFVALTVLSPASGYLVKARWQDMTGHYMQRGEQMAAIFDPNSIQITTVIDQAQIDKVRTGLKRVEVLFDAIPNKPLTAYVQRIIPAAADQLPSKYLGSLMGGSIAVDDRDAEGTRLLSKHFIVDVRLDQRSRLDLKFQPVNARVKFVLQDVSFADRLLDWLQVNLLRTYGWSL